MAVTLAEFWTDVSPPAVALWPLLVDESVSIPDPQRVMTENNHLWSCPAMDFNLRS